MSTRVAILAFVLLAPRPAAAAAADAADSAGSGGYVLTLNLATAVVGYYALEYEHPVSKSVSLFGEVSLLRTRMGGVLISGPGLTLGARQYFGGDAPRGFFVFPEFFAHNLNSENGEDRNLMVGAGLVGGHSWTSCQGSCCLDLSVGAGFNASTGGYRVSSGARNTGLQVLPVLRVNVGVFFGAEGPQTPPSPVAPSLAERLTLQLPASHAVPVVPQR